jgi:hypothetical protein
VYAEVTSREGDAADAAIAAVGTDMARVGAGPDDVRDGVEGEGGDRLRVGQRDRRDLLVWRRHLILSGLCHDHVFDAPSHF